MTHIWWVRHGPTHEKAFVGWRDVPADLSDIDAIARTSDYLPDDALICASDLIRASSTADAIANGRRRLPDMPALREFDFGVWDGMTFDESWDQVTARVRLAVDNLIAEHPNQHVVLVAHIGVIMTQIQRASGGTAYAAMGHQIANFSVTDMGFDGTDWTIGTINHVA